MRGPDLDRARSLALAHLANVVDPAPTPATPAQAAPETLAAAGDVEAVALAPLDVDASSLLPAAELLATVASAWVASKWGASWMVTPERATTIGRALVRVAQKYLPSAESWGCEAELAIALGDWALAGAAPMLAGAAEDVHANANEARP